jgi:hypothetical protein
MFSGMLGAYLFGLASVYVGVALILAVTAILGARANRREWEAFERELVDLLHSTSTARPAR